MLPTEPWPPRSMPIVAWLSCHRPTFGSTKQRLEESQEESQATHTATFSSERQCHTFMSTEVQFMGPGILSVCAYGCMRVHACIVPCAHMHFCTTSVHTYVHVCMCACAHTYECVDVCACIPRVEMP